MLPQQWWFGVASALVLSLGSFSFGYRMGEGGPPGKAERLKDGDFLMGD